jgi:hypothetical protein
LRVFGDNVELRNCDSAMTTPIATRCSRRPCSCTPN